MAFTLGSFTADTTLSHAAVLAAPVPGSAYVQTSEFSEFVLDSTIAQNALGSFQIGAWIPISFTWTPAGGVTVGGRALIVGDPWIPAGGVALGGSAVVGGYSVLWSQNYPLGGVTVGGAAAVASGWNQYNPVGGVTVGGAATVSSTSNLITATISATRPKPGAVLSNPTQLLSIKAKQPIVRAAITVSLPVYGTILAANPKATVSMAGWVGNVGVISVRAPVITSALGGWSASVGTIAARVTKPKSNLSGWAAVVSSISAKLSKPGAQISLSFSVAQQVVMVTNLLTKAVTFYTQYPFNSFAKIGTNYYAAGPGGFYQIDTDAVDGDFNGTVLQPIDGLFRFGQMRFGSEKQKRVSDCYIAMRAENNMTLRVYVDEQAAQEYNIDPGSVASIKQRRGLIGKGLKGKYWQLEFENNAGGNFDFDTINIAAAPLSRSI